jgi:hypothetical protein
MLGLVSTRIGDHPNDKYVECCYKVYLHLVAWEAVGEDTKRSYSACLHKIAQNASRKKNGDEDFVAAGKNALHLTSCKGFPFVVDFLHSACQQR